MEELMELNSFTEGQVLSVGMQLRVKKIQPEAGEPSLEDLPSSVETSVAANEGVNKAQEKATGTSKEEAKDSEATVSGKISLEEEVRKSVTHRVRPGETLYGIATLYRTSIEAIQKANKMGRRRVLRAGALLKIPNEQEKRTSRSSLKKTKSSERRTFS